MRRSGLAFGLALLLAGAARGQVTVEVTQEQQQFLPGETIAVAVRITNLSGRTLRLGAEADWLTFAVESRDGSAVVPKLGDVPVAGAFELPSSKVAIKRVDIAPYFGFGEPGRYAVVATVRIKEWNSEVVSEPKAFNLIEGAKLWEQEVGVPNPEAGSTAAPELRKYILQQANYLQGQIRLYLRVVDASGKVSRVRTIGPMVSFGRPEPQVDRHSDLHVLYQNGPYSFNYTVYNPAGDLLIRQTYDYINTRPRLAMDPDGKVAVIGGVRRFTTKDLPPPAAPPENEPVKPPAPPQGAASPPPPPPTQE